MRTPLGKAKLLLLAPLAAAAALAALGTSTPKASAEDVDPQTKRERCATRVSIAVLGTSPVQALRDAPDPQSQVDAMLADPAFIERFSRFANAKMNDDPGENATTDSAYHMAKFVLQNKRPWKDMFSAPLNVVVGQNNAVTVTEDAQGLGYFRSVPWLRRYAGNEEQGVKIATAYRILQNVVGLKLVASTNLPNADISATGRAAPACKGCHFDNWYALDNISKVLTRKVVNGNDITFTPPTGGPQQLLGKTIADDKDLVNALVDSDHFRFRACRLAFEYLYGRAENVCEGPVFDKCMNEFKTTQTIQSAISSVAKDATFCQ